MDSVKIKCEHIDKRGRPCTGCYAFLYKGNVNICKSSQIEDYLEEVEDSKLLMEFKCTSCKKKTFLLMS